jgi:hypothetical protein
MGFVCFAPYASVLQTLFFIAKRLGFALGWFDLAQEN